MWAPPGNSADISVRLEPCFTPSIEAGRENGCQWGTPDVEDRQGMKSGI